MNNMLQDVRLALANEIAKIKAEKKLISDCLKEVLLAEKQFDELFDKDGENDNEVIDNARNKYHDAIVKLAEAAKVGKEICHFQGPGNRRWELDARWGNAFCVYSRNNTIQSNLC